MRQADIYRKGAFAGVLTEDGGEYRFCYDEAYLKRDDAQPFGNPLLEELPFRARRRARDKRYVMAFFKMALARQKRVLLCAADDHSRDHMADIHGFL